MSHHVTGHGLWLCAMVWFGAAIICPRPARAEKESNPAAVALARSHFAQGLKHLDKDEWQDAATSFQSALQLRPSPEVRFNLGTALSELGRVTEALAQVETILADPSARTDVRKAAATLKVSLAKRLGKIVVQSNDREDILSVLVDARFADRELWAAGVPVDPGIHHVSVSRIDTQSLHQQVDVQPGQTLVIHLVPLSPAVLAPTMARQLQPAPAPKTSHAWMWWAAGMAGTALVSVALVATQRDGRELVEGSAGHYQIGVK